jgi:hypothetical protein
LDHNETEAQCAGLYDASISGAAFWLALFVIRVRIIGGFQRHIKETEELPARIKAVNSASP